MRRALFAVMAAALAAAPAHAMEQGEVVWVDADCSHFIAKIGDEFGTYQWRTGKGPSLGDVMEGELLNLEMGVRDLTNKTTNGTHTVYILAVGPRLHSMIHTAPVQCKSRFKNAVK